MNITEWHLTIAGKCGEKEKIIELTYYGNENIVLSSTYMDDKEDDKFTIKIPRHALEKFLEMINNG